MQIQPSFAMAYGSLTSCALPTDTALSLQIQKFNDRWRHSPQTYTHAADYDTSIETAQIEHVPGSVKPQATVRLQHVGCIILLSHAYVSHVVAAHYRMNVSNQKYHVCCAFKGTNAR